MTLTKEDETTKLLLRYGTALEERQRMPKLIVFAAAYPPHKYEERERHGSSSLHIASLIVLAVSTSWSVSHSQ
jgi:hypothetical protein